MVYGFRLPDDIYLRTNFKIKLGRTQRPDPYQRIKEQRGLMIFCTSCDCNRKFENIIHLFFKYANFRRGNQIEWFHFREKINVGKIIADIKDLVENAMDRLGISRTNLSLNVSYETEQVQMSPSHGLSQNIKYNINNASQFELMQLPGIGKNLSDKIIKYRRCYSFNDIEDIMNIPYIGLVVFNSIRDLITV